MNCVENSDQYLLKVEKITKVFPGTKALDEIDFDLKRGEVHAIVGQNGAGKSTLMKILSGAYTKTSGKIVVNDKTVEIKDIQDARKLGISMIYQELENIKKISVAENIFLGRLPKSKIPWVTDFTKLNRVTELALGEHGVQIKPQAKVQSLSVAEQQFLEIIKAITTEFAKIIIMDEPTSSLSKDETEKLFTIIRGLKKKGIGIIYISHRIDEIINIADRASVFRDGKNVGTLPKEELDGKTIVTMMLGHELERSYKKEVNKSEVVFEVKNLNILKRIIDFNMKLYKGEIVGISGLMGSGKDELAKSLVGLWPATSKKIFVSGRKMKSLTPGKAIKLGIVYLPEERKEHSLFLQLNVKLNIAIIWMAYVYRKFFLRNRAINKIANFYVEELMIKTPDIFEQIVNLSGGNQQKSIFARLMSINPKIMILNDPTRGIDVGSKEDIYRYIRKMASKGTSIIILSSEIPEISYLSNRVIVLSKGTVVDEFVGDEITNRNILVSATKALSKQ